MIYLIRHGERADDGVQHERESVVHDFDPHLTGKGYQQAHLTGLFFKKELQERGLKGAIIISSPFDRCIRTAENIAKELPNTNIMLSYGLGEYYKENWFSRDILDELSIYKEGKYNEVPYEQVRQKYPENLQEFFGRFSENYVRARDYFISLNLTDFALLIVTHGFGIHAAYNYEKIFDFFKHIDYCSVSRVEYFITPKNKTKGKVTLKNYNEHLINAKL